MSETIYDALRESHETQRSLCRRLLLLMTLMFLFVNMLQSALS